MTTTSSSLALEATTFAEDIVVTGLDLAVHDDKALPEVVETDGASMTTCASSYGAWWCAGCGVRCGQGLPVIPLGRPCELAVKMTQSTPWLWTRHKTERASRHWNRSGRVVHRRDRDSGPPTPRGYLVVAPGWLQWAAAPILMHPWHS